MTQHIIAVLGAADPEMQAIETLCRECGVEVVYALDSTGERVTPRTAYSAATPRHDLIWMNGRGRILAIECDWQHLDGETGDVMRIDHHRLGDPGFGRPPQEFFGASSLGQVCAVLGLAILYAHRDDACVVLGEAEGQTGWDYAWSGIGERDGVRVAPGATRWPTGKHGLWPGLACPEIGIDPHDVLIAAAADHCLGAAFAGHCPGVSRDDVREYRARCASMRPSDPIDREEYERRFQATLDRLVELVELDRAPILDLRSIGHLAELPDVACYLGIAYLTEVTERNACPVCGRTGGAIAADESHGYDPTGPCHSGPSGRKVVIGGATTPEQVRAFIEQWAPGHGLTGIYGDPERGFAGGYLSGPWHPDPERAESYATAAEAVEAIETPHEGDDESGDTEYRVVGEDEETSHELLAFTDADWVRALAASCVLEGSVATLDHALRRRDDPLPISVGMLRDMFAWVRGLSRTEFEALDSALDRGAPTDDEFRSLNV